MDKYVINQVIINAFQYNGNLMDNVPNWIKDALKNEKIIYNQDIPYEFYIQQKDNYIHVPIGNYILLIDDSLYSCEKNLFEELYKKLDIN